MTNYYDKFGTPIPPTVWAEMHQNRDYVIISKTKKDGIEVSTVWLGIDHALDDSRPLIFETMVFGGEHDQEIRRYTTLEEADQGHAEMCDLVFNNKRR